MLGTGIAFDSYNFQGKRFWFARSWICRDDEWRKQIKFIRHKVGLACLIDDASFLIGLRKFALRRNLSKTLAFHVGIISKKLNVLFCKWGAKNILGLNTNSLILIEANF